mmetsp:Transcript_34628/g.99791  ORF Transcript_34628/g.99791 Transcript_34628/m.99791 type:complete len:207 (+) Transcript_34628:399-1019(+)
MVLRDARRHVADFLHGPQLRPFGRGYLADSRVRQRHPRAGNRVLPDSRLLRKEAVQEVKTARPEAHCHRLRHHLALVDVLCVDRHVGARLDGAPTEDLGAFVRQVKGHRLRLRQFHAVDRSPGPGHPAYRPAVRQGPCGGSASGGQGAGDLRSELWHCRRSAAAAAALRLGHAGRHRCPPAGLRGGGRRPCSERGRRAPRERRRRW